MKVHFMLPLGHFIEQLGGTERQPAQEGDDTCSDAASVGIAGW